MGKKVVTIIVILLITAIFIPGINGFISKQIFYLDNPDIMIKKDSGKIILSEGDPEYDSISSRALDMIFSPNNFYSQAEHTLSIVSVGHIENVPHAQNSSYVQLPIKSPFYGKRVYVVLIDLSDTYGGGVYHSEVPSTRGDYFFRAYAANRADFEKLKRLIEELNI